jgi:hypothetical protein
LFPLAKPFFTTLNKPKKYHQNRGAVEQWHPNLYGCAQTKASSKLAVIRRKKENKPAFNILKIIYFSLYQQRS